MDSEFTCPECGKDHYSEYGLRMHKLRFHRKYGDEGRCHAYLLTPGSRRWNKYSGQSIRCTSPAKNNTNFCGNHVQLVSSIEEIVWKDDQ